MEENVSGCFSLNTVYINNNGQKAIWQKTSFDGAVVCKRNIVNIFYLLSYSPGDSMHQFS